VLQLFFDVLIFLGRLFTCAAAGAPTSPPIRGDQYVVQRVLHGQASRGGSTAGLLSLHDFGATTELART